MTNHTGARAPEAKAKRTLGSADGRGAGLVWRAAAAGAIMLCAAAGALAQERSKGVYRIPYENGTSVRVSRDFEDHTPLGRIDMSGKDGSGEYKIVAAADGTVRFVVDNFSEQIDSSTGKPCTNNYVWIEHANGEWTKYSHMQQNSSTQKAKLKVGQFVKAGTYLGDEGKVGCAGGDHLHFEVGVPRAADPVIATGGFLADNDGSKRNRVPRVCGIAGGVFDSGASYEARNVPGNIKPGSTEAAFHGVPEQDYQCLVDQAVAADYRVEWVDGYESKGKLFFNVVFRPELGARWSAVHNLGGAQYQAEYDKRKAAGYRLAQVDSYPAGAGIRYAAVFVKDGGPAVAAYHGVPAAEHQKKFDALTAGPWRPKNISVVSRGGERFYTALYESADAGSWQAKSFLTAAEYQQFTDENKQKGRGLAYLNVYEHAGQPHFSAIWKSSTTGAFKSRHDMSSGQYQQEWQQAVSGGMLTRAVTGYVEGSEVRFAAVWRK
jgi:murein DD-endopeptidase MepM/ murein hydrolase activator NlpD